MLSRLTAPLRRALGAADESNEPGLAERRKGLRVAQEARTITLSTAGIRTAFRLRNLSARGASGEADIELRDGASIVLEFERGQEVAGVVQWTKGPVAGIVFPAPIALDIIRYRDGPNAPRQERAPRYNVSRAATITLGSLSRAATIRNISSSGMMIESAFTLQSGQRVTVTTGKMVMHCQVRWSRHGMAGLAFTRAISLDAFSEADG